MLIAVIFSAVIFVSMILGILFFPKIHIGKKIVLDSYWVITCLGAILLLITGLGSLKSVISNLTADTAINPLKILVLFICMTILSVFLDELGFFSYLAEITLNKAGASRKKLFISLYVIVSVLTVFTSNDIIILSFTPFICYFSKHAKINPLPFLVAEFVGANTWSMALVIGNPTNVYLATAYGVDFIEYLKVMIIPTVLAGVTALGVMLFIFRKNLSRPLKQLNLTTLHQTVIADKPALIVGIVHLAICTILLAVSSYIGLEMWIISLGAVLSLSIIMLIIHLIRKTRPKALPNAIKRAPWQLVPFIISMFAIIIVLKDVGATKYLANILGDKASVFTYGISSFITANIINNIPMSVLFSSVIESAPSSVSIKAMYGAVIGSNLGALLTPIGALAGIMWSNILTKHKITFHYKDFIRIGFLISIPSLLVSLLSLSLII